MYKSIYKKEHFKFRNIYMESLAHNNVDQKDSRTHI